MLVWVNEISTYQIIKNRTRWTNNIASHCSHPIIPLLSSHHLTSLIPSSYCTHPIIPQHSSHYSIALIKLISSHIWSHHLTALIPSFHCSHPIIPLMSSYLPTALILSSHCSNPIIPLHSSYHSTALIPSSYCSHPIIPLHSSHYPSNVTIIRMYLTSFSTSPENSLDWWYQMQQSYWLRAPDEWGYVHPLSKEFTVALLYTPLPL